MRGGLRPGNRVNESSEGEGTLEEGEERKEEIWRRRRRGRSSRGGKAEDGRVKKEKG